MTETDKYFHPFILFQHYKNKIDNNKPHALSLSLSLWAPSCPPICRERPTRALSLSLDVDVERFSKVKSLSVYDVHSSTPFDRFWSFSLFARPPPARVRPSVRPSPARTRKDRGRNAL